MDWSDASEARQAAELAAQWAPIGVADALELLSPDFVNEEVGGWVCGGGGGGVSGWRPCGCEVPRCARVAPHPVKDGGAQRSCWPSPAGLEALCCLPLSHTQVRGHAVEVLQKTDDDELLYYLLQLVQVGTVARRCWHLIAARAIGELGQCRAQGLRGECFISRSALGGWLLYHTHRCWAAVPRTAGGLGIRRPGSSIAQHAPRPACTHAA